VPISEVGVPAGNWALTRTTPPAMLPTQLESSQATTPFVSPLPIPPPPIQVAPFTPSPEAVAHLRDLGGGVIPPNTRYYQLVE
jgi:hypothetical protein